MIRHSRQILFRYFMAVIASALALGIAEVFYEPIGQLSPFFLFYAAVAVTSWFGGFRPGLLATLLGAAATSYFLLNPRGSFAVETHGDTARLVLFVGVGALIAWLNGELRQSRQRCADEAAAARRAELRAKRLAEANVIGVFFSDLSGRILSCNDAFVELVGASRDEIKAGRMNWKDVTAGEHRGRDDNALRELRECRVCTPFEKDHVLRDGRRVPVLMGCAMLDESEEEFVGFVLDLSDRKRAEAEVRAHQEQLQAVASELMLAEDRERRRIATVLHDAVGQTLAMAQMKTDALRKRPDAVSLAPRLGEVHDLIDDAIRHARSLTSEISPPVLYELGLEAALQWLGDRLRDQHGIAFTLTDDRRPRPMTHETRIVLFQAVRELLVNVVKHARASACAVTISRVGDAGTTGQVRIVVTDNGRGLSPNGSRGGSKGDGFGLFNIRERLHHLGGSMQIDSPDGVGTTVTLVAPLAADAGGSHTSSKTGGPTP